MSSPFLYPKIKHQRLQQPYQYKNYRSFKRYLRQEFGAKCVYCLMPDSMRGWAQFGVDHYRPQSSFEDLENVYSNLFYCCNACNSLKNNYWPTLIHQSGYFIPNPCDYVMFDHMRYSNHIIQGKSKQGKFTIELLDLDDPQLQDYREEMLHLIDILEARLLEFDRTEIELASVFKAGKCNPTEYASAIVKIKDLRVVTERSLSRQMGTLYKDHYKLYGKVKYK